ncbi:MAG: ATP-binding protein [bacterium]|nr:ATP-binding protein [bacterium]
MSDHTLLLVSPSPEIARQVRAAALPLRNSLLHVTDAKEALRCLAALPTAVLLVDQYLEGGTGLDLLEEAKEANPHTQRILILDPHQPADAAVEALNRARVSWMLRRPLSNLGKTRTILRQAVAEYEREARGRAAVDTLQDLQQNEETSTDLRAKRVERLCTAGEMAGSLVHRFNNNLTIILGHLELLLQEYPNPQLEKRLQPVFQSTFDSVKLAKRLQEFLRDRPSEREPVDINELITDTLVLTEPVWRGGARQQAGEIDVQTHLGKTPDLSGNASELREIFTNLVLNAIDAMPLGGTLGIATSTKSGCIQIEISDTGQGMSEAVRSRIFEPFYTTKGEQGNGLGLSIVQRIVTDHGGDIRIESEPNQGSRFILRLPITPVARPTQERHQASAATSQMDAWNDPYSLKN